MFVGLFRRHPVHQCDQRTDKQENRRETDGCGGEQFFDARFGNRREQRSPAQSPQHIAQTDNRGGEGDLPSQVDCKLILVCRFRVAGRFLALVGLLNLSCFQVEFNNPWPCRDTTEANAISRQAGKTGSELLLHSIHGVKDSVRKLFLADFVPQMFLGIELG